MANFIEEFFYGNVDPQARNTKQGCSEANGNLDDKRGFANDGIDR